MFVMELSNSTAVICGLFCGICQAYPAYCEGCLSDKVAAPCVECSHGFRTCAKKHKVTRCFECVEFPCERIKQFSQDHIVNGICHHAHVIEDLQLMKEIGVSVWVQKQVAAHTCPNCGKLIAWYEQTCPNCKR